MHLKNEELIGLPVFTQSGQSLGRISSFEIDLETLTVSKFIIKSGNIIKGFLRNELLVDGSQIVSLDNEKMVVEDLILKEGSFETAAVAGQ